MTDLSYKKLILGNCEFVKEDNLLFTKYPIILITAMATNMYKTITF